MTNTLRNALATAVLVAALAGTTSCSKDNSDSASTTSVATTTTSAAASGDSTPESADPSGGGGSDGRCNAPRKAVEAALAGNAEVTKIKSDGSCGIGVTTSLTKEGGGLTKALAICDTASAAAYANGGTAVQVYSPNQVELSIGVKGTNCIGEP